MSQVNHAQGLSVLSYDLIIVGGGMIGVTAALTFAQLGLSIALVEAVEPEQETYAAFDQRAVALSAASVKIYQSLGLWSLISPLANSIEHIHISDRGHVGIARLSARSHQLGSFGQVIPLNQAGPLLWQQLKAQPLISVICPAKMVSVKTHEDCCQVTVDSLSDSCPPIELKAKLLIGADGTNSLVAKLANISIKKESYHQNAVICNIMTEKAHENRAFERFTSSGPLALLPLTQNQVSVVWCHQEGQVDEILACDDAEFIKKLQRAFGFRLGHITRVSKRFQYPLSLHVADQQYPPSVVLLGNSAHTLHPIAGQGFNLGLRDIAEMSDLLRDALGSQLDIGGKVFLERYVSLRQGDWRQTISATDSLARLFSNEFSPLVIARNKALTIFNLLPFAQRKLIASATGYGMRSSRLARGFFNTPLGKG